MYREGNHQKIIMKQDFLILNKDDVKHIIRKSAIEVIEKEERPRTTNIGIMTSSQEFEISLPGNEVEKITEYRTCNKVKEVIEVVGQTTDITNIVWGTLQDWLMEGHTGILQWKELGK